MPKFTNYFKLALCANLLQTATAIAYIAVPPSIFQDEDNLIYITLGGGVAWEEGTDWGGVNGVPVPPDPEDDTSTVGFGNAAIGFGFEDYPFRIEVAYNFIGEAKFKWAEAFDTTLIDPSMPGELFNFKANTYTNLGMLNLYGDLPITENWIPYIKIGAGYGVNSTKLTYSVHETGTPHVEYSSDRVDTKNFVWNGGVGLNYAFSEDWSLGADVTYLYLGRAKVAAYVPSAAEDLEVAELKDLSAVVASLNLGFHF